MMKDGGSYLINNAGRIVALITAMIAVLVTFANVSFSAFAEESFTVSLAVMLFSSYVIYFSLEASGERLGEGSDEFNSAIGKYNSVRDMITPEDITELREFCFDYAREDAKNRQRILLSEAGLAWDEYLEYKEGRIFSQRQRAVFRRCDRIRPARLTPPLLLSREGSTARCELKGPLGAKILSFILGLLPTTLGAFFTVSVILTAKSELTASVIIEGIIKLSALPIIGFKGYSSGYSFVKNSKSKWIETKADILNEFIARRSKKQ